MSCSFQGGHNTSHTYRTLLDLLAVVEGAGATDIPALQRTNISHQWKRKLIFLTTLGWDRVSGSVPIKRSFQLISDIECLESCAKHDAMDLHMFPSAPLISILYTNTFVAILEKIYVAMKLFFDIPSSFWCFFNVTTQNEKIRSRQRLDRNRDLLHLFLPLGFLEATFNARKVYRPKNPGTRIVRIYSKPASTFWRHVKSCPKSWKITIRMALVNKCK